LRTLKSVSKHWQAAQKTERKSESESEIAMCDRMQMYNIKMLLAVASTVIPGFSSIRTPWPSVLFLEVGSLLRWGKVTVYVWNRSFDTTISVLSRPPRQCGFCQCRSETIRSALCKKRQQIIRQKFTNIFRKKMEVREVNFAWKLLVYLL
jgi:hypothetical protein